jgi:hypothetical protein
MTTMMRIAAATTSLRIIELERFSLSCADSD